MKVLVVPCNKCHKQNVLQAALSYFFVEDELRQLAELLPGRSPVELAGAISELRQARGAGTDARIDAIAVALRSALTARPLFNSETKSAAASNIINNIVQAASDALGAIRSITVMDDLKSMLTAA